MLLSSEVTTEHKIMMDSLQSQPEWAGFSPRPPRSRSWRQPRAPALQPWPAGFGPDRPYKATLQDADLWSPPDPTSPAPLQLRYSSLQKPHTLKQHLINIILTFMLWIKKKRTPVWDMRCDRIESHPSVSVHSPSSVTLSTTDSNTNTSVLPSVLPPNPLSLLRPVGPTHARHGRITF